MNTMILKAALLALPLSLSATALADDYKITITNLTHAQLFTPILVASHKQGSPVFVAGHTASPELEAVAEGGDTAPLEVLLGSSDDTLDIASSGGLLAPGESVTVELEADKKHRYLSVVSMLIPTNDAFFGVSGLRLPRKEGKTMTHWVPAYDAGTEVNDEICLHIPGPVCGGEGMSVEDGEGFVSIHRGIHGIADLSAETYDWRNPVASITVEKM